MGKQFEEYLNESQNPYAPPQYEAVGSLEKIEEKNPWQYFIGVLKKYAVFQGRARRAEYWWFILFRTIFAIVFSIIDRTFNIYIFGDVRLINTLWNLALMLPSWSVMVRRMHDCNKSGWFMFIPIYNFILCCTEGTYGQNEYGHDSKWENYKNGEEGKNVILPEKIYGEQVEGENLSYTVYKAIRRTELYNSPNVNDRADFVLSYNTSVKLLETGEKFILKGLPSRWCKIQASTDKELWCVYEDLKRVQ